MKIALIYFSPTQNTKRIADVISKEISSKCEISQYNITSYYDRQKRYDFSAYDAFIFGSPIYAGKPPLIFRSWLKELNGNNRKTGIFFTYGGISTGIAQYTMVNLLRERGFTCVSAAEFLAKHTFNAGGFKLLESKPNEEEFKFAREFADHTFEKFSGKFNVKLKIDEPHNGINKDKEMEGRAKAMIETPSIISERCTECKVCFESCPSNSIREDLSAINGETCMRCFSCFQKCPENAIKVPDLTPLFKHFLKARNLTIEKINQKISKLYI